MDGDPTKENKQNSQYEFADYGLLYKTTIMKNIVTMFGAESRHTRTGNVIVFSKQKVDNLIKMRNKKRISVSEIDSTPAAVNRGEGSEGSEGSQDGKGNAQDHLSPHEYAGGEWSEGSEGSIEGPTYFYRVLSWH